MLKLTNESGILNAVPLSVKETTHEIKNKVDNNKK